MTTATEPMPRPVKTPGGRWRGGTHALGRGVSRRWQSVELRARLLGDAVPDRLWGWIGPLAVTLLGGFIRFWHLDRPGKLVFDEVYYVKEAASYLKVGYELRIDSTTAPTDGPDAFTTGTWDVFTNSGDFVVHPPVGKWMIAFGEWIFGPTSVWGWRFSAALVGTLSILMVGRIARRMFRSSLLGTLAALLLAFDGMHYVHSRTGILDIFVMFWALAGFGFMVIDRDVARERLAVKVLDGADLSLFGPGLGVRWWRIAGALSLALCASTKWSGLFFFAAFCTMSVLWDLNARRAAGVRHWFVGGLLRDGLPGVVTLVPLGVATYIASWTGWFLSKGGYDRQWGAENTSIHFSWVPEPFKTPLDALRSLWKYHREMWDFNITLTSHHDYMSNPWSWLVQGRPTAFFWTNQAKDTRGCTYAECAKAIHDLGNPVVWWGAVVALVFVVAAWALARDWRAGAVLAGFVGGYLPWFMYQERTIFTFYAVAFVPWVVLALTYALGLALGPRDADPYRRLIGGWVVGCVAVAVVVVFSFFYPVLSARMISRAAWEMRMWLPSWI